MNHLHTARRGHRRTGHPPRPVVSLHVFIGYGDLPAVRRATAAVGTGARKAGRDIEIHPLLWRFEQLASSHWRDRAITAALEAHVVVLTSSAGSVPHAIETWVADFLAAARGRTTTLVVIPSPAEAWTISLEQPAAVALPATHPARDELVA